MSQNDEDQEEILHDDVETVADFSYLGNGIYSEVDVKRL